MYIYMGCVGRQSSTKEGNWACWKQILSLGDFLFIVLPCYKGLNNIHDHFKDMNEDYKQYYFCLKCSVKFQKMDIKGAVASELLITIAQMAFCVGVITWSQYSNRCYKWCFSWWFQHKYHTTTNHLLKWISFRGKTI